MPRGEPAPRGSRAVGLAIAAVFALVCLGALTLVVMTTRACDGWFGGTAVVTPPTEPFPGADAALVPLGSRDCLAAGGPLMGGPVPVVGVAAVASELRRRGYQAIEGDWGDPQPMPLRFSAHGLAGGCGVAAFVPEPGARIDAAGAEAGVEAVPCTQAVATVAMCGDAVTPVSGTGNVWARTFVFPGLTPSAVEASGIPAHATLAHAEAELSLRSLGWLPETQVLHDPVSTGTPGMAHTPTPPAAPTSGCIAWVVVGEGVGRSQTEWAGRPIDQDAAQGTFTAGVIACAPDPSGAPNETRLTLFDSGGDGGQLWWRPYAPQAGPTVPTNALDQTVTVGDARVVERADLRVPAGVPMATAAAQAP